MIFKHIRHLISAEQLCNSSPWYLSAVPFPPTQGIIQASSPLVAPLSPCAPFQAGYHTINWLLQLKRGAQVSLLLLRVWDWQVYQSSPTAYSNRGLLQATKLMHPLDYTRLCLKIPHISLILARGAHKGCPERPISGALSSVLGNDGEMLSVAAD